MSEQVSNEIRVNPAPPNFLGIIGQVYFVIFYDQTGQGSTIGTIYPDGTFAPPTLNASIEELKHDVTITSATQEILSRAKTPRPTSR